MATDITQITLRDTTQAPFTNKGAELTYSEMDNDLITVGLFSYEMQAAIDVAAYDGGTTYNTGDRVAYGSALWQWIAVASGSGTTPSTNPAIWEQVTIGLLLHEKNKDSQLVGTFGTITADDIITGGTGLTFDLTLNGTTGAGEVGYIQLGDIPPIGTVIDVVSWLTKEANLTAVGDAVVSLVYYDGTPANDILIGTAYDYADLNSNKLTKEDAPVLIADGARVLALRITGANLSGNLILRATFFA